MRVIIDVTPVLQSRAGLGRYAAELAKALHATAPAGEQIELFYLNSQHRDLPPPLDALRAHALPLAAKPWRFKVMMAHLLRRSQYQAVGSPNVFIATDHLLPYLPQTNTIFTLGDVTFRSHRQAHARLNRTYLRWMMPLFTSRAGTVTAISECTLQDGCQYYPALKKSGRVIYPAVGYQFNPVTEAPALRGVQQKYNLPNQFFLYVGTIEPRKNLPLLFQALAQAKVSVPEAKLVIAGKKGWLYEQTFSQVQALHLTKDVLFTGYVPDEDLPALYSLATAFVFPSLYEGFGLPVLEAMGCGTPVLCSNTSSLPEVAGEAAMLLPPNDASVWVAALVRIMQDESLRTLLRRRGFEQAKKFAWTNTAEQIREIYSAL